MTGLIILALLVALAVLAPRWGVDTHRSREWSYDGVLETWPVPDRDSRVRRSGSGH